MISASKKSAIATKQVALRDQLWPGSEALLWQRKTNKGFTTIPKTFPLILQIMDEMTKDTPVSRTYMALWCSTWDNSFVSLSKPREMAYASGFSGQRMEYTWSSRMKLLKNLGFIAIKSGKAGPLSHALILNPHFVIRRHYLQKTPGLIEASYTALIEWGLDIGAADIIADLPDFEILISKSEPGTTTASGPAAAA